MEETLGTKILSLRKQGFTYIKIMETLNCSKGVVSYHCGKGQKEKTIIRKNSLKLTTKYKIYKKIDNFKCRVIAGYMGHVKRTPDYIHFYNKIVSNPICYLTGVTIDLSDSNSYCLDHIIPFSVSQDNSIENMGLCSKDVNKSKSDLSVERYLELCKETLEFAGYTVTL